MVVGHVGWLGPCSCRMSHSLKKITKKYGERKAIEAFLVFVLSCLICLVLSCLVLSSTCEHRRISVAGQARRLVNLNPNT